MFYRILTALPFILAMVQLPFRYDSISYEAFKTIPVEAFLQSLIDQNFRQFRGFDRVCFPRNSGEKTLFCAQLFFVTAQFMIHFIQMALTQVLHIIFDFFWYYEETDF